MVKFQWFSLEKRVKYKINEKKMEGEHMRLHFTKMEGLGNDYVYVNCFKEKVEHPSELAVRVSDRHFGIGSDGLILIKPSEVCTMRTARRVRCVETVSAASESMCMIMG